ncbi:MAG: hypothetical protein ACLFWM_10635 [Actinomycetota bacterium]
MASEKRTGRRRRNKALADCRREIHRYGSPRPVGGGMTRQTCWVCGAVSIDVSLADPPLARVPAALSPEPHSR